MEHAEFKNNVIRKLVNLFAEDGIKLAGYTANPDVAAGDMDATHEAISSGTPVSRVPTKYEDASTHPGHSGKDAPMEEKLENADGIKPEEWTGPKNAEKSASLSKQALEVILKGIDDSLTMDEIEDLVAKSVKETIKDHLTPKETELDGDVQGTSKPEKVDDGAAGKAVKAKAGKKPKKTVTRKGRDEEADEDYHRHMDDMGDPAYAAADAAKKKQDDAYYDSLKEDPDVLQAVFKSFQEAHDWNNPDPDKYFIRPTTRQEKKEFGRNKGYIVDVKPQKEPTGAFGNRRVKKGYSVHDAEINKLKEQGPIDDGEDTPADFSEAEENAWSDYKGQSAPDGGSEPYRAPKKNG